MSSSSARLSPASGTLRRIAAESSPALILAVVLIAAWIASARALPALPSPAETIAALGDLADSGQLWAIAWKTSLFMGVTSGLSALVGVPWGIASGSWSWLDRATSPYLFALRSLPAGMWIPIAAVLVGTAGGGLRAMGFVVVVGALPAMVLATKQAVGTIPPLLLRAGRTFGGGRRDLMRRVVLPGAMPGILGGLELGWAMGFRALIAGEIYFSLSGDSAAGTGIGAIIQHSRTTGELAPMLATTLLILVVGMLMDRAVFGTLHERLRHQRGLVDA